jgi:hypothetical protein
MVTSGGVKPGLTNMGVNTLVSTAQANIPRPWVDEGVQKEISEWKSGAVQAYGDKNFVLVWKEPLPVEVSYDNWDLNN